MADLHYQAQALPIRWVHEDKKLAELVHKDPELAGLPCLQSVLPYK